VSYIEGSSAIIFSELLSSIILDFVGFIVSAIAPTYQRHGSRNVVLDKLGFSINIE